MRLSVGLALILVPLVVCVLAVPALAQTANTAPRRLTFDGRSTPIAWDATGILVTRPGAVIQDGGGMRIANELWRINPANGSSTLISADAPLTGRAPDGKTPTTSIFVVNAGSLQPELWLSALDSSGARLLLKGDGEYFDAPLVSPDGKHFAFTRTPTGSETHVFSAVWLGDSDGANLRLHIAEASSPVWSPDGSTLAFEHRGDVYIGDWRVEIGDWQAQRPTSNVQSHSTRDDPRAAYAGQRELFQLVHVSPHHVDGRHCADVAVRGVCQLRRAN